MYAVIFKAQIAELNDEYSKTAAKMRELAFSKYGCLDFVAVCEGEQEVAISYWPDEQSILAWKQDPEHLLAQQLGQKNWYQSYSVEVVEIKRQYRSN